MVLARVAAVAVVVLASLVCGTRGLQDKGGCPPSFKNLCSCGMGFSRYDLFKTKRYTVNCTNTGFTDAKMLQDLSNRTEVLIFTGNTIPILPYNVFSNMRFFDYLEVIDMSNNHLKFIQGRSFHKVYNVKTLILDHNDLEITDEKERPRIFSNFENLERLHLTNAFSEKINSSDYLLSLDDIFYESELIYLKILHLEQNEIWTIGDNEKLFCQLPALEQLHLGQNRLIDFDFRVDCLHALRYIDLEMNIIPRLSAEAMTRLDSIMSDRTDLQIKLTENPFSCDCRAKNFIRWLNTTLVKVVDWKKYTCQDGYPESNIGKPLGKVGDLLCPSYHNAKRAKSDNSSPVSNYDAGVYIDDHSDRPHYHGYSSATIGALSFFLVFTSSLLLAVAYYHRRSIKGKVEPYWDFLTRKIGYTGLSNDEAPQEVNV